MNSLRTVLGAIAISMVSVLMSGPAPVAASGPVIFDVHLTRHGLYENCGSFNVTFVADINAHFEQFFNDSGQLVLERRHVQFTGALTNATTGASLPYEGNFIATRDVAANTLTNDGVFRKTEVPGEGVLAIAAGRTVLNATTFAVISESGQTPAAYNDAICRLLG